MADQIKISSFSLRYPGAEQTALSSVSLEVAAGTCVGIVGPTGAGKTTLLHALSGILGKHHVDISAQGSIQIAEHVFEGIPRDVLFPGVGLVLQDPVVQLSGVCETVRDEIMFTLENLGIPLLSGSALETLADDLGIGRLLERKPATLSGGETQRVALATILIARPPILLLDEPAVSLDTSAQNRLRSIIHSMKGMTTVILTDTRLDFLLATCDEIVALDHGNVAFQGPPASFLSSPNVSHDPAMKQWKSYFQKIAELRDRAPFRASRIRRAIGLP